MTEEAEDIAELIEGITKQVDADKYDFKKCATRLDRNGPYHQEDVIAALIATNGHLANSARLLGRQRLRLKDWIYRNPDVLDFLEDMMQSSLDTIERNYIAEAIAGDMKVSRHVLSTRGRDRGYGQQPSALVVNPNIVPFDGFNLNVVTPNEVEGDEE